MIGFRYTRSRKSSQFISFIALVSMIGIALGTIVLITVMSVMNGFQSELHERILGMVAHVEIGQSQKGLSHLQELEKEVITHPDVVATAPYIDVQAMFKHSNRTGYVLVKGILPNKEKDVSIIDKYFKCTILNESNKSG